MQDVDVMESFTSFTCGGHAKLLEKFEVFEYNISPVDCAALRDEGADYLSDALKSDNCKLTNLEIG